MADIDIHKTEPPDFLPRYLTNSINSSKDLTIKLTNGSLEVDKIVLCALSHYSSIYDEHDQIIVESSLESGVHLKNLIYTGLTHIRDKEEGRNTQSLLKMLGINIDIELVEKSQSVMNHFVKSDFEVAVVNTMSLMDSIPDINSIIMANMNQNENNVAVTQAHSGNSILETKLKTKEGTKIKEKNKKIFVCDFHPCIMDKLMFEGISKFKRHTHKVHNAKPLACPEAKNGCKFRADDFSKLGNHVQGVHKNIYSENITCEECHKTFPSQSYLKTHMKRMHKQNISEREKICPYCGETKLQLNDHIMRAHKSRQFRCEICPKTFKTSVQLRIHKNVHTGFKPYTCKSCDQRFSRLHHRKTHLEKFGHIAGPVLKPEDHVDKRSRKSSNPTLPGVMMAYENQNGLDKTLYIDDDMEQINSDHLNKAIGVDCAEIIKNMTMGSSELDF